MDETSPGVAHVTAEETERLRQAVYDSPAVEVTTAVDGRPRTFPLSPFYDSETGRIVVTSPPAFAGKIEAVAENPKVSLLFYGVEEPFLLRGRASVDAEDLEANAEYVRRLAASEPPSEKSEGFSKTAKLLESSIGRFLLGWYALRIVVEIEPIAIESVDGTAGTLPAWPQQGLDAEEAGSYDRIAVGVVDEEGWPVSRSVADVAVRGEEALLDVSLSVEAGQPACLLCHWHTPGLDKLGQRLFRGRCRPEDSGVAFKPASSFSMRNATLLDRLKFIVEGKRRTRAYFD